MWTTSSWPVFTYTDCIVELLKAGADPTGTWSFPQERLQDTLAYDSNASTTRKSESSKATSGSKRKKSRHKVNMKKKDASDNTIAESILERSLRLYPQSVTTRILQAVVENKKAASDLEQLFAEELLELRDECRKKLKKL